MNEIKSLEKVILKTNEDVERYKVKYKDYNFRIDWTDSRAFNPENDLVDVILTTKDGNDYYANFTTPKFINYIFEKNKHTGECLEGSYFCMPANIVIVKKIGRDIIKKIIDELINNLEVHHYFRKID